MREEIRASRSCGRRAQSAVIPSRLSTARIATVYLIGAFVTHDPDALNRKQDCETLPEARVPALPLDLVRNDGIGPAQEIQSRTGHLAKNAHREAGTRERLPHDKRIVEPQLSSDGAHFVLEQLAQRFDELHPHALGQSARRCDDS